MRELAERAYFVACSALGRVLRTARYSKVRIDRSDGEMRVRKKRLVHAPLLVWMARPLATTLGTGVRVLPQQEWEEQERRLYRSLRGASIRIDPGGQLVLPCLAGRTLATLLEDSALQGSDRDSAIALAVRALAEFHRRGFTHGDAMAENVLIDLEAGAAHWFDFETVHDASRPMEWRRADDLRALAATCLVRTAPARLAATLQLILDVYAGDEVTRHLAAMFASAWRRPLVFHLAQARLPFPRFAEIGRLLSERVRSPEPAGAARPARAGERLRLRRRRPST